MENRNGLIWVDEEFGESAKNKIARAAVGLAVPVIRRRCEFGAVGETAPRVKTGSANW